MVKLPQPPASSEPPAWAALVPKPLSTPPHGWGYGAGTAQACPSAGRMASTLLPVTKRWTLTIAKDTTAGFTGLS